MYTRGTDWDNHFHNGFKIMNATLKNNYEPWVSQFYRVKKFQLGPGVALLEGCLN